MFLIFLFIFIILAFEPEILTQEQWIQQNPSEDGDSEAPTTTTMVGSVSRDYVNPSTSLLDSPNTGLDFLPVALSVANASRTVNNHSGPSYASIAAASADSEVPPGLRGRPMEPAAMTPRRDAVVNAQQPRRPPTAGSDSSDNTAKGPSPNPPAAAPTPETAWVEDEFSALTISQAGSSIDPSGWARPVSQNTLIQNIVCLFPSVGCSHLNRRTNAARIS